MKKKKNISQQTPLSGCEFKFFEVFRFPTKDGARAGPGFVWTMVERPTARVCVCVCVYCMRVREWCCVCECHYVGMRVHGVYT